MADLEKLSGSENKDVRKQFWKFILPTSYFLRAFGGNAASCSRRFLFLAPFPSSWKPLSLSDAHLHFLHHWQCYYPPLAVSMLGGGGALYNRHNGKLFDTNQEFLIRSLIMSSLSYGASYCNEPFSMIIIKGSERISPPISVISDSTIYIS